MLRIWGRTSSINVQKVLWCATELGLAFERIDAGGAFGIVATPEYRARNPNGLVPTIDDDGFLLWESNVIVRYLAAKHGALLPAGVEQRFLAEKWMDWQQTALQPAIRTAFFGLVRTKPENRDNAAIEASLRDTERALATLEMQLSVTPYVAGDAFTVGDIPVGAGIHRCFALGIEQPRFPHAARWYAALSARPPYREHIMQPLS